MGDGFSLQARGASDWHTPHDNNNERPDWENWTPPVDALLFAHLDQRVDRAMADENGYWNTPEVRWQHIMQRFLRAGYVVRRSHE